LIWLAFLSIPAVLVYFVRRRRDVPFSWMFWMFGAFIVSCGFTHFMEVVTFGTPVYRLSGLVKFVTAVLSWATVLALIPVVPKALTLRSPRELEQDFAERKRIGEELQRARNELEDRTAALTEANAALKKEITERQRAEDEARDRAACLRAIVDTAVDGIITVDAQGMVASFNPAAERLFGYRAEEVLGQNVRLLMPAPYREEHDGYLSRYLSTGVKKVIGIGREVVGRRKDGSTFPAELAVSEMSVAGRRMFTGIVRDSSERKEAEEALRESEEKHRFVAEAVPALVWSNLPDGYNDYLNRRWIEYTGLSQVESQGEGWAKVLHPDDLERTLARWAHSLRTGQPYQIEYRLRSASDGRYRWFLAQGLPMTGEAGRIVRWFGTCTDIDDRKRAEEALRASEEQLKAINATLEQRVAERTATVERQAEELTRSNADLQQFAYVASHDLQEPLRMVASYLELLARRYRGQLDAKADKYIAYAMDGATRMQALIQDLLTLSRVGTHAKPTEPTDSGAVVDQVCADLREAIKAKGAAVTREPLPTVWVDRIQLGQVFQNLIGNALKFCDQEAPRVHVGARRDGADWVFSVRDNGIGIAAEDAGRIFLVFQRLHTRAQYPGTGIGLAICKKVVERHGGRIWVEPRPGQGSVFFFALPAPEDAPTVPAAVRGTERPRPFRRGDSHEYGNRGEAG
jgi:PAS domain S-box-containing protein